MNEAAFVIGGMIAFILFIVLVIMIGLIWLKTKFGETQNWIESNRSPEREPVNPFSTEWNNK